MEVKKTGKRKKRIERGRRRNGCGGFYLLIRCSAWSQDLAR